MRRAITAFFLALLSGLGMAGEVTAGYAHVEFDIGDSQVLLPVDVGVAVTLTIPFQDGNPTKPTGSIAGTFSAALPVHGSSIDKAATDIGAITDLDLSVTVNADYSLFHVWGQINSMNIGWGIGSFEGNGRVVSPGTGLIMQTDTFLECSSPLDLCPALAQQFQGNFPLNRVTTKALNEDESLTVSVNSINSIDNAWFVATLTIDIGSPNATQTTPAILVLDGREIPGTRTMTSLVPEPETLTLLAAGIAGLLAIGGGVAGARRRDRRG